MRKDIYKSIGTASQEALIFNGLAKKKPLMKFHTEHAEQILRKMECSIMSYPAKTGKNRGPRVCLELAPWWLLQLSKSRVERGHGDTGSGLRGTAWMDAFDICPLQ